ncbi:MAG: amino acid--tRNA ligase-related protein, partial [bacterium]
MTTGEKSKMDEHEIIKLRKDKIKKLREEKIHPFTNTKQPDTTAADIIEKFSDFPKDKLEETDKEERFSIAGRLMSLRVMGKLAFAHLQDETASIQVMFTKNFMKDNFAIFKETVDVGDIIWVEGEIFMTRKGELSILVHEHLLLTKNSRPLPEKFHGLTDKETRYRQRYVDLLMNEDVRKVFKKRTEIIKYIRNFMDNRGFMEVETPMMHPLVSGAAARPFVTHHNTLDMSLYMRIAPECYLKRLLVGGLGKVYEINRNFRNEGMDSMHNPEFTMMEFYWPYVTFKEQM